MNDQLLMLWVNVRSQAAGLVVKLITYTKHMLLQTLSERHTSAVSLTTRLTVTGYNEGVRAMFVEELLRYRLTNVVFLFNG